MPCCAAGELPSFQQYGLYPKSREVVRNRTPDDAAADDNYLSLVRQRGAHGINGDLVLRDACIDAKAFLVIAALMRQKIGFIPADTRCDRDFTMDFEVPRFRRSR